MTLLRKLWAGTMTLLTLCSARRHDDAPQTMTFLRKLWAGTMTLLTLCFVALVTRRTWSASCPVPPVCSASRSCVDWQLYGCLLPTLLYVCGCAAVAFLPDAIQVVDGSNEESEDVSEVRNVASRPTGCYAIILIIINGVFISYDPTTKDDKLRTCTVDENGVFHGVANSKALVACGLFALNIVSLFEMAKTPITSSPMPTLMAWISVALTLVVNLIFRGVHLYFLALLWIMLISILGPAVGLALHYRVPPGRASRRQSHRTAYMLPPGVTVNTESEDRHLLNP